MKRNFFIALLVALVVVSCKDDEKEGVNLDNPTYAKKTVGQTKTDMENTGTKMVDEMKSFSKEPGMNATVNLVDLASSSSNSSSTMSLSVFKTLSAVKAVSMNKASANEIVTALENNNISLLAEYKKISGVYTYNFSTNDWDIVYDKNASIKFVFPASKASRDAKKLDGTLEVFIPVVKTGSFEFEGQTLSELPTSLKYSLSVDSKEVVVYKFDASYNDNGLPINVTTSLTISTFEFKVNYGYKTSDVFVNYTFKHGSETILDFGVAANGNFDKTNIENANTTTTVSDEYGTYEETDFAPEKVIYNANAHFQLLDIKTIGKVDIKSFYPAAKKIDNDSVDQQVALVNKYMDLVVVYASNNQAIAKAEAYKTIEVDAYLGYEKNKVTGMYEDVYGDKPVLGFRMKFADKSVEDFDKYFTDVYNNMLTNINSFVTELNNTYKGIDIIDIAPMEKMK